MDAATYLSLADYRRRVFALYAAVRARWPSDPAAAHARWIATRNILFGTHPQSALDVHQRARFTGLRYYPYDPAWAFCVPLEPAPEAAHPLARSGGGTIDFKQIGWVTLPFGRFAVFWLETYGGGLFLPFRDGTNGQTTYGGGRYLLDTAKGADLGSRPNGELILDFNFAYHPSCAYNDRWSCPLAPSTNRTATRIEAGEQLPI
jgi:uncharacterized protein (DUF1684 family)